jgi:hypothetical protein
MNQAKISCLRGSLIALGWSLWWKLRQHRNVMLNVQCRARQGHPQTTDYMKVRSSYYSTHLYTPGIDKLSERSTVNWEASPVLHMLPTTARASKKGSSVYFSNWLSCGGGDTMTDCRKQKSRPIIMRKCFACWIVGAVHRFTCWTRRSSCTGREIFIGGNRYKGTQIGPL